MEVSEDEEKETENYKSESEVGSLRKPKSQKQGLRRKKHQKRQNPPKKQENKPQKEHSQFGTSFDHPTFQFESLRAHTVYN